jgi:hypothetical protein
METSEFEKNSDNILRYISAQTNFPWSNQTWLGNRHTLGFDQISEVNQNFTSCLLLSNKSKYSQYLPILDYQMSYDEQVNILWIIPISDSTLTTMQEVGVEKYIDNNCKMENVYVYNGEMKFL